MKPRQVYLRKKKKAQSQMKDCMSLCSKIFPDPEVAKVWFVTTNAKLGEKPFDAILAGRGHLVVKLLNSYLDGKEK